MAGMLNSSGIPLHMLNHIDGDAIVVVILAAADVTSLSISRTSVRLTIEFLPLMPLTLLPEAPIDPA